MTIGTILAVYGVGMLVAGVGDLVRRRRSVEGRVLRVRERGDENHRFWHLAVDDGTSDRIRAWRVGSAPAVHQGATVRARVSPWLCHVVDLSMIREPTSPSSRRRRPPPRRSRPGPPPAIGAGLPDAAVVAAAIGQPVSLAPAAVPHPLAIDGASRTFVTRDGGRIIAAWIRASEFEDFRRMPPSVATPVAGVGDEAYHSQLGGGLVARVNGRVLMVAATLPSLDDAERDRVIVVGRTADRRKRCVSLARRCR